jgi:hypothetical protein
MRLVRVDPAAGLSAGALALASLSSAISLSLLVGPTT